MLVVLVFLGSKIVPNRNDFVRVREVGSGSSLSWSLPGGVFVVVVVRCNTHKLSLSFLFRHIRSLGIKFLIYLFTRSRKLHVWMYGVTSSHHHPSPIIIIANRHPPSSSFVALFRSSCITHPSFIHIQYPNICFPGLLLYFYSLSSSHPHPLLHLY